MNIRSIVNKIHVFQNFVFSRSFDIVAVTETWLSEKNFDNEILPCTYIIIRGSCGSGVLFAIKSCLPYEVLSTPPSVEVLSVSVKIQPSTV